MMSEIPKNLDNMRREDINREILRVGMIAELDAVSLYEQLAAMTDNQGIKRVFMDIAKEEKTHAGEFQALLLREDREQAQENENGKKEVEKLVGR